MLQGIGSPKTKEAPAELGEEEDVPSTLTTFGRSAGSLLVRDCLLFLACAKGGLTEEELRSLLAPEGHDVLPVAAWSHLFHS